MLELNESNFQQETSEGVVVVDFYAAWCQPCLLLSPILEQVTGAKVVKVNVDDAPKLCAEHAISSIPRLFFIKDGVIVDKVTGFVPLKAIQDRVDALNS